MSTYVLIYALVLGAVFASPPSAQAESRLVNISTRARVETGDNIMIGGFVIEGDTPQTVLVRAVGPSLAPGVPGVLPNPIVTLFNSGGTPIARNDDWQVVDALCAGLCGTPADITATSLAPTNPLESAIFITLNPGPYTAHVTGFGGSTGVGLIEVYEVEGTIGTFPDARGTYTVSGQAVQSNCPIPSDNGTTPLSGEFRITSQTGANFGGSATLNGPSSDENPGRVEVTLSGTINAAGQFSGTFTYTFFENNVLNDTGSGTFSGSLAGNVITLTVTPTQQPGDCTIVVSLSGTR